MYYNKDCISKKKKSVEQRSFHFTVATLSLPFCNLTSILKLEIICIFKFQRLIGQGNEFKRKGKSRLLVKLADYAN